jgi:glycosyltransferase involved in cell wall biosynthesis
LRVVNVLPIGKAVGYLFPSTLVLMAALDEEVGIDYTLSELRQCLGDPQVLVVDGNSSDKTAEVAKDLGAEVILQAGKGKGNAIAQAIKHVKGDFDFVILIDADYTYPAEFIPQMIKILVKNPQVGMVCGNRFNSHFELRGMLNIFYLGNRILAFAHNMLNGINLRDPLTGLRVLRWEVLKNWKPKSDGFDVEVELNHYVERMGYQIVEIPIAYRPRIGEKKLKLGDGISIFKRVLTESI